MWIISFCIFHITRVKQRQFNDFTYEYILNNSRAFLVVQRLGAHLAGDTCSIPGPGGSHVLQGS